MPTLTAPSRPGTGDPRRSQLERNYHVGIACLIAVVVAIGFGPTAGERLFRAPSPRPAILFIHVALFTGWVLLFVVQASLVRINRVSWHRRLGQFGFVIGSLVPFVGCATAVSMERLHQAEGDTGGAAFLIISFFDMLAFAAAFGFAMYYRRQPAYHRRLLVIATCCLTSAAFARLPRWFVPANSWYLFVDALILSGVGLDILMVRRIHTVYRIALPLLFFGQATAMWTYLTNAAPWIAIANRILG